MTDLLDEHPILGPLIVGVVVWAMLLVTALVALPYVHPQLSAGAASVAVSIVGVPAASFGVLQWLKGK